MNKAELVAAVAEKTNFTKKDAEAAVNALIASVEEALVKGDKVQLIGFGTFETRERKARQGRNPRKPDEIIKPRGVCWIKHQPFSIMIGFSFIINFLNFF